jgi:hypothetical protein
MDIDSASTFLSGAILLGLGFIVVGIVILVLNNIFHKYWKPVRIFTEDSWVAFNPTSQSPRFIEPNEIAPVDKTNEPKLK